jgi:hypothetical protein
MPKTKSVQQVRFLMSKGSPLTKDQKDKMVREMHSGAVKVTKKRGRA